MDLQGDFHVYDTTLRDGAQQEGLNLSVADKLTIARQLDELGVGFIEGGWPGANPKDTEFFARARDELDLRHARLTAFGATRRAGVRAADDPLVAALRDSGASVVTLVAKSHQRHVELALRTTLEENLAMVRDTVSHLRRRGPAGLPRRRALLRRLPRQPRLRARGAAHGVRRGRRGGRAVRHQRRDAARLGRRRRPRRRGDDRRAGSASTATTTPAARSPTRWPRSTPARPTCRARSTGTASAPATPTWSRSSPTSSSSSTARCCPTGCSRRPPGSPTRSPRSPTCRRRRASRTSARSAFAHKAGLHASAIKVDPDLYQHMDPVGVGNDMRLLVSDMAGRASIELKGRELGFDLLRRPRPGRPGHRAGQGDGVARLHLRGRGRVVRAAAGRGGRRARARRTSTVESWRVITETLTHAGPGEEAVSEATVKLRRRGRAVRRDRRGQRPGQRARPGAAAGARCRRSRRSRSSS